MKPSLPREIPSDDSIPALVQGYVSVQGPSSVFGNAGSLSKSSKGYHAKKADLDSVRRDLEKTGFTILAESPLGIAVAGSPSAFEDLTGGRIEAREVLTRAEGGCVRYVTHLDIVGDDQPKTLSVGRVKSKRGKIDGILLERPRIMMAVFPSPIPPNTSRFHLRVPEDIVTGLGASQAHQKGYRGDGVTVAMPDSGWYRHPYFTAHHYTVNTPITVVPGTDRSKDPVGHGTGESAPLLAAAPSIALQPIRTSNDAGDLSGAIAGFLKAKELNPKIITCSWGGDGPYPPTGDPDQFELAFAAEIQHAVESGILVVFSAGNGQFSVEPQIPGVLSAGGTYMSESLELWASNYASGYESPWFGGVRVPIVCGLVGQLPRAQYIMLPISPGCAIDVDESQPDLPDDPLDDGTTANDGWALFSGTSAAAPQLAGVGALILSAKPGLKPAQIIESMCKTAIDVTAGNCHPRFNNDAKVGPDLATGHGFVNASDAVQYALEHF